MEDEARGERNGKRAAHNVEEGTSSAHATHPRARRFQRTSIIAAAAALLVLLIVIGARLYTAYVAQDLILTLTPDEASLQLSHSEQATISFAVQTSAFPLCTTTCTATLRSLADNTSTNEATVAGNLTYILTAPATGEGQLLYQVSVTCMNEAQVLCARSGIPHRATALITLDYAPSAAERASQQDAATILATYLGELRQIDLASQEATADTTALQAGRGLSLSGLEATTATLAAWRDAHISDAEQLTQLYDEEEYAAVNAGIPADAAAALDEAEGVLADFQTYVQTQHNLTRDLQAARTSLSVLDNADHLFQADDEPMLDASASAAVAALRRVAMRVNRDPSADILNRSADLAAYETTRANLIVAASNLAGQDSNETAAAIVALQALLTNNSNGTTNTASNMSVLVNVDPDEAFIQSLATLQEQCSVLANLNASITWNVTTINATLFNATIQNMTDALRRCAVAFGANSTLVPSGLTTLTFSAITLPVTNATSAIEPSVETLPPRCCVAGNCPACCDVAPCRLLPVLFLHGHSMSLRNAPAYSLEAFNSLKAQLQEDGVLVDAGSLTPYSTYVAFPAGDWGRGPVPVGVAGTYYYDAYLSGSSYILSVEKSESIDTYAIRLKDLVATLKAWTGAPQVVIVAHSMGGLVARRYLQVFGSADVAALIMIGTPNHGINGSIATLCPLLGADKECSEMRASSSMLATLNDPSLQPSVPMTVIAGSGCSTGGQDGDGVVTVASAELPQAATIIVQGSCGGTDTLHTAMLDPTRYPVVYAALRGLLINATQPATSKQ